MTLDIFKTVSVFVGEMIGTAVLVFFGTGVAATDASRTDIALAFGFAGLAAVSALLPLSGGHINPAVSLGLASLGHMDLLLLPVYLVAQFVGGMLGALAVDRLLASVAPAVNHAAGVGVWNAFGLELLSTAVLVFGVVVLAKHPEFIDVSPATVPLFVCMQITIAHLLLVPATGCSINPARSFGPAVVANDFGDLWIFLLAPLIGGVLGSMTATGLLWLVNRPPPRPVQDQ